jgi:flagellar hook assembly protein FlgD
MKYIILTAISILFAMANVNAQSDALLINLKSAQTDTIAIVQIQKIQFENVVSVEEQSEKTANLSVKGNNPNPFNEQTTIEFEIAKSGNVKIIIYDNSGKQIQTLKCENCRAGKNALQWNCLNANDNRVRSGVYYYEVRFNDEIQSKKMILIK